TSISANSFRVRVFTVVSPQRTTDGQLQAMPWVLPTGKHSPSRGPLSGSTVNGWLRETINRMERVPHCKRAAVNRGSLSVLLDEHLLALPANGRQDRDENGGDGQGEQGRRDRSFDEDHRVAPRDDHGAAQMFFEQRTQ